MRVKATIAYDGTDFHGFAAQAGDVRTIERELTQVLEKILHSNVKLICAGRTDAGVHAKGQVLSFDIPDDFDVETVRAAVNGNLQPEVAMTAIENVSDEFSARFDAKLRTYRYTVVNRPQPDPMLARYALWISDRLDLEGLNELAAHFLGDHDFASFCRRGSEGTTTTRTVSNSHWERTDDDIFYYWISAPAFCWQMVRSIVGTTLDLARHRISTSIPDMFDEADRNAAGTIALPHGLCLWSVDY